VQSAFVRFDGTALDGGSVHVTMLDANSQVILDEAISTQVAPTAGPTRAGVAGDWQVRIEYANASGAVQINAQGSQ
jgi:hypothetical protein